MSKPKKKKKKNLLIATDNFLPRWDGIASFLNELVPRIEKDYNITLIAPDFGDHKKKVTYKSKVIKFKLFKLRMGDYYPAIVKKKVLAKEIKKADVIFLQSLGPIGLWTTLFAKRFKKPAIRYNHSNEWELFPNSLGKRLLKTPINLLSKFLGRILYNMYKVVIVSSIEQVELLNLMGIRCEKKVVHLGVDVNHYKPSKIALAKHELGIDPRKFVIGYAGRLGHEKDLKTLYRAFLRMTKKYDDVLLLIAGGGHPELERLFSNKSNVIFTGPKDDLSLYYQAMDVYVLPSLTETTSLTTMEAMATATPVVVTPVGFMKEYINDGVNGMLFPKKNSYALYSKLQHLKENHEDRVKLGRNGRETIKEHYDWDKTAENIKKIIDLVSIQDSGNLAE